MSLSDKIIKPSKKSITQYEPLLEVRELKKVLKSLKDYKWKCKHDKYYRGYVKADCVADFFNFFDKEFGKDLLDALPQDGGKDGK